LNSIIGIESFADKCFAISVFPVPGIPKSNAPFPMLLFIAFSIA